MPLKRKRIDLLLVDRGIFPSRSKAKEAIYDGRIFVDGKPVLKPSSLVSLDSNIKVVEKKEWVSRGAYKLCHAIDFFHIDVKGKVCMDIGASTGGFTECLLFHGAKRVYAVDVGYGQLAYSLRIDERVVSIERTNFRYMPKENIKENIELFSMDVSFISIKKLIPRFNEFGDRWEAVVLIKPQFEAGREFVKKGVVRDRDVHRAVLEDIDSFLRGSDFYIYGYTFSPILGPKGNIEFLVYFGNVNRKSKLSESERDPVLVSLVDDSYSKFFLD